MNGTSTLQVKYCLSQAYMDQQFLETGVRLYEKQSCELDMSQATPEQRAAIMREAGGGMQLDWHYYGSRPTFDGEPTIAQLAEAVTRYHDQQDTERRAELLKKVAEKTQRINDEFEKRTYPRPNYLLLEPRDMRDAERLDVDLSAYSEALARYDEILPELAAQRAQTDEALRLADERSIQKREQEKQAAEQLKLDWIAAYGSEHLKRAIEAGHTCTRKYLTERAELEFPGFVLDFNDRAEWKSRSCPSLAALDERDALLKTHPDATVEIVWLTTEPSARIDEDDYYEPDDEREALVVGHKNYGQYLLVK